MTTAQAAALRLALQAILDAMKEAGSTGAPGGVSTQRSSAGSRLPSSSS